MPYSQTTLNSTGTFLTAQMKDALDAALTAHPKYSRVTTGYVSSTKTFDVWKNDGTTDGYEWYLIVQTDSANTGRVLMGGCLEYDPATFIAKKAMRGNATLGFTDSNGYPTVSAGGAEMTFALGSFSPTTSNTVGLLGASNTLPPTASSTGILRVCVSGKFAWIWWGTTTAATHCHGVGTYDKLHTHPGDSKPLAFIAHSGTANATTVWQNPNVTSGVYMRSAMCLTVSAAANIANDCYSPLMGIIPNGPDISIGQYVGSRGMITRQTFLPGSGGDSSTPTTGSFVGLCPADFLLFMRTNTVTLADTVTVNGKVYVSITPPSLYPGYFVNTQPV